mmetsp:Transcript_106673/g.217627  ORF Transcript_106673/g.217627 Transcript_106673/m.217627 type:complete len:459 (+) Transcript_106673:2-1378(+)
MEVPCPGGQLVPGPGTGDLGRPPRSPRIGERLRQQRPLPGKIDLRRVVEAPPPRAADPRHPRGPGGGNPRGRDRRRRHRFRDTQRALCRLRPGGPRELLQRRPEDRSIDPRGIDGRLCRGRLPALPVQRRGVLARPGNPPRHLPGQPPLPRLFRAGTVLHPPAAHRLRLQARHPHGGGLLLRGRLRQDDPQQGDLPAGRGMERGLRPPADGPHAGADEGDRRNGKPARDGPGYEHPAESLSQELRRGADGGLRAGAFRWWELRVVVLEFQDGGRRLCRMGLFEGTPRGMDATGPPPQRFLGERVRDLPRHLQPDGRFLFDRRGIPRPPNPRLEPVAGMGEQRRFRRFRSQRARRRPAPVRHHAAPELVRSPKGLRPGLVPAAGLRDGRPRGPAEVAEAAREARARVHRAEGLRMVRDGSTANENETKTKRGCNKQTTTTTNHVLGDNDFRTKAHENHP